MTIITIESDSVETTQLFIQYAKELGLSYKLQEHRVLTDHDVAFGIGRKATEAELEEYFAREDGDEPIDIETVFERFKDK